VAKDFHQKKKKLSPNLANVFRKTRILRQKIPFLFWRNFSHFGEIWQLKKEKKNTLFPILA
jgi:hypothetical protein